MLYHKNGEMSGTGATRGGAVARQPPQHNVNAPDPIIINETPIKMATITCTAMVQWSNGADLKEETIQVAPPKAGEVRVKILASGASQSTHQDT